MDAERPIEKLLRTTAQKRAEDAGEPLSPHPATRRLLQGEVTRVYGRAQSAAEPSGSAARSLGRLWPSLGWSFALLLGLTLAASLMLPPRKTQDYEMAMAPKPTSAATPSEAPAQLSAQSLVRNESLSDEARADRDRAQISQSKPQPEPLLAYDQAARKSKLDSLDAAANKDGALREQANAPASAALAAAPPITASGAATRSKAETDAFGGQPVSPAAPAQTLALAPSPPTLLPAPKRALEESEKKTQLALSEGIANQRASGGTRYVQAPAIAGALLDKATPPILATFHFEQTGSQIRVVDADGSVYTGSITPSVLNKTASDVSASVLANQSFKRLPAGAAETNLEGKSAFSFQAEGTNQTLKQKVLLTGALYRSPGVEDLKKAFTNAAPADAPKQNEPAAVNGIDASRISGKAVLGNSVFDINAISAP